MSSVSDNATPVARRRSSIRIPRPLWIGVATALLVVAMIGLQVGVPIYQQQIAIREIERHAGEIAFRRVGPTWLRSLVGERRMEIIDEVQSIRFPFYGGMFRKHGVKFVNPAWIRPEVPPGDDQALACIANLRHLRQLKLDLADVGDAGIEHLRSLHNLQELRLNGTDISDAGLGFLGELRNLTELSLELTDITDEGLGHLKRLSSLRLLSVDDEHVTDEGVADLQRALPGLTVHWSSRADLKRFNRSLP